MTGTARLWRHDWQVVRLHHDGAVVPVSNHRHMRLADAVAWALDAWTAATHRTTGTPTYCYDVRLTPRRPSVQRFCVYCNADTTDPNVDANHDVDCPRHRPPAAPLTDRWENRT